MRRFEDMVGKTLTAIDTTVDDDGDVVAMRFTFADGTGALLYHDQDCCEFVRLYETVGNLDDLIGTPLVKTEESSNSDDPPPDGDYCHTWTFYHLATVKGFVTLRWLGESNGYYSESVEFRQIKKDGQ